MVSDFDKIKILSHDFPMKETFLWNGSENRQVMTSIRTIFNVLEGGVEIFDRPQKFTPTRNKV